ncbi:HAMP domain-containing protein [Halalkalibacterium halodurans]|uniref:sensor histidine kinase n=1 Tax=Halalkalibacterium halodurans TaxID=86665 RepID=UPI00106744B3|nr:ATP-binding protein [Halalkalibacterium halodurans]TES54594.1 HAMP domain-containing protein [Halalkalibacterium halodurans]
MRNWFQSLSFRNRILVVLLLITLLMSSFSLVLIASISEVNDVSKKISNEGVPELAWLTSWQEELAVKTFLVESYLNEEWCCDLVEEYQSIHSDQDGNIPEAWTRLPSSLEEIKMSMERLDFEMINNVQGLLDFGDEEGARSYLQTQFLPRIEEVELELSEARSNVLSTLNDHSSSLTTIIHQSLWLLFIVTVMVIGFSIVAAYRISGKLTNPLERMVDQVDAISKGQYGLYLTSTPQFEMQQMTVAINEMSKRLKSSFDTLFNEKKYREQILNSLPIGIITFDHQSNELSLNTAARLWVQASESDILLRQVEENQAFWQLFWSNSMCQNVKVSFSNSEGTHQVLVSKTELFNDQQIVIGQIFYFIDITEVEEMAKRMHQSEKLALVGEMAAGAAHEIRNPLAVIHGFISLMKQTMPDSNENKSYMPLLLQEIDRINGIIDEMLLLAKPGAPILKRGDIKEMAEELIPLIRHSYGHDDLKIEMKLDSAVVMMDRKQMKQVLHNLIKNSIDAVGGTGTVTLYSKVDESGWYHLFIRDTGKGIPSHLQETIFEPFSSSKESGTGLGLTIVQRIIENHHGSIQLVDSSENGTTFQISLPLADDA